jgi:hypothetical protein
MFLGETVEEKARLSALKYRMRQRAMNSLQRFQPVDLPCLSQEFRIWFSRSGFGVPDLCITRKSPPYALSALRCP